MNGRKRRWGFGLLAVGLVAAIMALGVGTALAAGGRMGPSGRGSSYSTAAPTGITATFFRTRYPWQLSAD